jgi:uncharacterized SAM-binding protein YcdF (DUF218 family)
MCRFHISSYWLISAGAFAVLLSFANFTRQLPVADEISAGMQAGDGIVVPTGGYARVATGLDLLKQGGARLLITGVYPGTPLSAVLAETSREVPACCVDLDYAANNTADNAIAAAAWEKLHHFPRIHLVTSWYHMPRSLLLFHRALPGITIVPHPVFPPQWVGKPWWSQWVGWRLVAIEFGKYSWEWVSLRINWSNRI